MRYPAIDSLRGLAALWVLFYHIWNRFYPGLTSQSHPVALPDDGGLVLQGSFALFGYGYIGVTLFFVLSGFCIHLPQAKRFAAAGKDQLIPREFVRRRFWRLYPAYFASLVLTSLLLGLFPVLLWLSRGTSFSPVEAFHLDDFLVNGLFLQQVFPKSMAFNGVYWTLLYEVQFYAFYPLLLLIARRFGFGKVALALLACELVLISYPIPIGTFFLDRYFEWYLGMLLAERTAVGQRLPGGLIALTGLVAGIAATFFPAAWPYRHLLLSIGFAGLLQLVIEHPIQWLVSAPLVWLGAISYSIYLVHVPLIDFLWGAGSIAIKYGALDEPAARSLSLLAIPLTLGVAELSYRWFEKPYLRGYPSRAPVACEQVAQSPASS